MANVSREGAMKIINAIFKYKKDEELNEYIIPVYKMKNGKYSCLRGWYEDYMPLLTELTKNAIQNKYIQVGEYDSKKGIVAYYN